MTQHLRTNERKHAMTTEERKIAQDIWTKVIRETRSKLTAEEARFILDNMHYWKQRPIRQFRVKSHAEKMKKKLDWLDGGQITFAVANFTNERYKEGEIILIDGYHRLNAQVLIGNSMEWQLRKITCHNELDINTAYMSIDTDMGIRTKKEVINASGLLEFINISPSYAENLYGAALLLENNFQYISYQNNPAQLNSMWRIEIMNKYANEAEQYWNILAENDSLSRKRLATVQVLAVALATLRDQPEKAEDFWRGIAADDGLRSSDPRKVLLKRINEISAIKATNTVEICKIAASAWNAWYRGEQIKYIKTSSKKIAILGTKWGK